MEGLHLGFQIVMRDAPNPVFFFSSQTGLVNTEPPTTPSLLTNIGSGVSIIKIGETLERVTGTCLGGGTLLGLATSILGVRNYEDILDLCERGHSENADLMLSDIYGSEAPHTLAVSLGRLAMGNKEDFKKEDIAKSLMNMVAFNIGQIAYLAAKLQKIDHIYFAGNFIRNYTYTMDRLSYAVNYWSQGQIKPLFLKYDGFFGVLGALFKDC